MGKRLRWFFDLYDIGKTTWAKKGVSYLKDKIKEYLDGMGEEQKKKAGLLIAGLLILLALIPSRPIISIIIFISFVLTIKTQYRTSQKVGLFFLPLLTAVFAGYLFANVTAAVIEAFNPQKIEAIHWWSWFTFSELSNPANIAGRAGVIIGSIGGCLLLPVLKQRMRSVKLHGPGLCQGYEVVQGGWSDIPELIDICEIGMPRSGKKIKE